MLFFCNVRCYLASKYLFSLFVVCLYTCQKMRKDFRKKKGKQNMPYYLGQSALLDQYALSNSMNPFYKNSVIVHPLDQYGPINLLQAFQYVKIIYQCYSSNQGFPAQKRQEIQETCSKLHFQYEKMQENRSGQQVKK